MFLRLTQAARRRPTGSLPRTLSSPAACQRLPEGAANSYSRRMPHRQEPWLMRTYAGHTNPQAANALFRTNLAKGQTGLSVAFDLATQTGYDSDDPMAAGEVGKVGVPICHIGDMQA